MAETGKVRSKRRKFAQVSSHCLRNNNLSLRAKGLYSIIQNYIDIPGYVLYKSVLMNNDCKEGRDVFNKTWKELVDAGYLKVYKMNTKNGFVYEYELLDEPEDETNSEPSEGKSSAIKTKVKSLTPGTENPYVVPDTELPHVGFPDVGNPTPNNTDNNNTDNKNTNKKNTNNKNTNHYINNGIDNTLNTVEQTKKYETVVVETEKEKSFLESVKKESRVIEREILNDNRSYDCFDDPSIDCSDNRDVPYIIDFNDFHKNRSLSSLYRYRDIAIAWIRDAIARRSSEHMEKVENLYAQVINTIIEPELRYALANFTGQEHLSAMKKISEYFDPESSNTIYNPQGYAAKTLYKLATAKLIEMVNNLE